MKDKSSLPSSGVLYMLIGSLVLCRMVADAQVINFDVPGGVAGSVNYSGQGALSDPGNNYWNAVVGNGTTSSGFTSDGLTASLITLTDTYGAGGGSVYSGDGQGPNGTPSALFSPYEYNKNSTYNTNKLNNVPPGTYNLYLYADNGGSGDSDRGTAFTVWTAVTAPTTLGTTNKPADYNTFVQGVNYVVFSNLTLTATGTINIAWTANTAATNNGANPQTEGSFNGLQLQTVDLAPYVSVRPISVFLNIGASTQLVSTVYGVSPFSYQWQTQTNGVFVDNVDSGDIMGSQTNALSFGSAALSDAGAYRLIVTNGYGAMTSQVATVMMNLTPVITTQPGPLILVAGNAAQLTATVLGGTPLSYQWQKGTNGIFVNCSDTGDVIGSTSNVLNFSAVSFSDAADYQLIATNTSGSVTSQMANVAVYLTYPVGARTPFTSYEAESGVWGGGATMIYLTNASTTEFSSPSLEASGHAFVQLAGTGQYVQWTNNTGKAITTLNIRYSIPDAPSGGGISNTIDLYVGGIYRGQIPVNSYQTWVYETSSSYNGMSQSPSAGNAHVFWDEVALFVPGGSIPAGATFTLQKDSGNTASYYNIDVVDLETPSAPLSQPANSLSILSYGAQSNNPSFDNTSALQNCINAAQSQAKIVWIPPGNFYVNPGSAFQVNGITIQGAGPWYSEIINVSTAWTNAFIFNASSTSFKNFCIDATKPSSTPGEDAFTAYGNNWTIDNVWARHLMLTWGTGNNITVKNSRVNNSWGNGININNDNGTACIGVTISNNFVRGCGDDSISINSSDSNPSVPVMANCTVVDNTTVASWWANQLAVYGGSNILFANNLLCDAVKQSGIHIDTYNTGSPLKNITVQGNTILRGGGLGYGDYFPAIGISGGQTETNVTVNNNNIYNCMFQAIAIGNVNNLTLQYNTITAPGFGGIMIQSSSTGDAVIDDNIVSGLPLGEPMYYNSSSSYVGSSATATFVRPAVEAVSYNTLVSANAYRETCGEGGQDLCKLHNGDYTVYNQVNLNGVGSFVARVASTNVAGNIEIHLDSPTGTLIGNCAVTGTGGGQTWDDVSCNISSAGGYHDVYLVFTGSSGDLMSLEWFVLLGNGNRMEAASYNDGFGIQTENCIEGGLDVTNITNGSYVTYHQLNLTGATAFNARVAGAGAGGNIQIRLDSPTGTIIGTATVSPTGGWQTWSTVTCQLNASASGYHDVYLVFTGGSGSLFNLEWLQFQFASASASTSNLAWDRPVTVSSVADSSPGANAVDGNLNTRWSSAYSDPQWIYVDLGANYNLTAVTLAWESAYGKAYQIQVSTNASNWTTIYSTTNGAGGTENLTGLSGVGRYVRMYGTQRGSQYGYSLWEFEVFGSVPEPVVTTQSPALSIQISPAQGLALRWPDDGNRELPLQPDVYFTPSLAPPMTWMLITNVPTYSNGQWMLNLPIDTTDGQNFYRLQK